jgi:predicted Zn finger-like uncharacterized protein
MAGGNARAAMFTVCPKCALTLVVSAADLRVAQGYVRCGRCSSVFNALARLSDEQQAAISAGEPVVAPAPEPETPVQEERADLSPLDEALSGPEEAGTPELPRTADEPVSEDALEFNPETDVGAVFVQPPPDPQWTAAAGSFKAMRAASQEPTPGESAPGTPGDSQLDVEIDAAFLAELLREPGPAESAGPSSEPPPAELPRPAPPQVPEPEERAPPKRAAPPSAELPAPPPRDSAPEPGKAAAGAAIRRAALPEVSPRATVRHAPPHTRPPAQASTRPGSPGAREPEPAAPEAQAPQAQEEALPAALNLDLNTDERTTPRGIAARFRFSREEPQVWAAGVVLGLVLLTAQIVNHYRDELAATPRFNRPLTALYASLGVQLLPHWDVRAYEVRQLGASADPTGNGIITLHASIKNSGRLPQPLPLLRVTLQDRFGNQIAARDVAPRFYVPPKVPESSYLASGQRIDAEMGFLDPGANAVGFEIDACLPASGGGISCANDLATR